MNVQQLKYIVALNRFRNFARAAEACQVSQPTLSAMLVKLEEELDTRIFERNNKAVSPTTAGKKIIRQAETALQEIERIQEIVMEDKGEIGGRYQPQIITPLLAFLSCHKNAFNRLSQYLVHDSCRTVLFTDAAAYAQILIHYCITSPVDADSFLGTYLYANTTCHAAVVLSLSLVFCHRFLLIG